MWKDECQNVQTRKLKGGCENKMNLNLLGKGLTCIRDYRVHFPDQGSNKSCTRLRCLHGSGFNNLVAVVSMVTRDLLRIPVVFVLGIDRTVFKAANGPVKCPRSPYCRIALFILFIVSL